MWSQQENLDRFRQMEAEEIRKAAIVAGREHDPELRAFYALSGPTSRELISGDAQARAATIAHRLAVAVPRLIAVLEKKGLLTGPDIEHILGLPAGSWPAATAPPPAG